MLLLISKFTISATFIYHLSNIDLRVHNIVACHCKQFYPFLTIHNLPVCALHLKQTPISSCFNCHMLADKAEYLLHIERVLCDTVEEILQWKQKEKPKWVFYTVKYNAKSKMEMLEKRHNMDAYCIVYFCHCSMELSSHIKKNYNIIVWQTI